MAGKMYVIKINESNLGQIIDGLNCRREAYHITAEYHETGRCDDEHCIEDVKDADEANALAAFYDDIVTDLKSQRDRQDFMEKTMKENSEKGK